MNMVGKNNALLYFIMCIYYKRIYKLIYTLYSNQLYTINKIMKGYNIKLLFIFATK